MRHDGTDPRLYNSRSMLVGRSFAGIHGTFIDLVDAILRDLLERDDDYLASIRRLLLEPQESYSIAELAALWRIPWDDARDVYHDELLRRAQTHPEEGDCVRVEWAEAVGVGLEFHLLRPYDVERALGSEFSCVRPESWRTVPVLIRLPRYIVEALCRGCDGPATQTVAEHVERSMLELFEGEHRR